MEDSKSSLAMGGALDRPLSSIIQSICDGYSAFIVAIRRYVKRSPKKTLAYYALTAGREEGPACCWSRAWWVACISTICIQNTFPVRGVGSE